MPAATPTAPPTPARAPVHLPALDGYRGLAALLVTVYHCWLFTDAPLDQGPLRGLVAAMGLGVELFFVLSGFVLLLPVARRDGDFGSLGAYARRRFARIAPAYMVAVVVQASLAPWLAGVPSPFLNLGGLANFAAHLLFLQHEIPRWLLRSLGLHAPVMGFGVNGALWSLSIEVLFYAALPLVAAAFCRRPGRGLLLGLLGAGAWRALAWHAPTLAAATGSARGVAVAGDVPRLVEQIPGFAGQFALGMAAAWLFANALSDNPNTVARSLRRYASGLVTLGWLALLTSLMAAGSIGGTDGGFYARQLDDLLPSAAFALLLLATPLAQSRLAALAGSRAARWTGDVSYGCFLWHLPLILLFTHVLGFFREPGNSAFFGLLALVVPSALFFGHLSRHLIEEPAIRWGRSVET